MIHFGGRAQQSVFEQGFQVILVDSKIIEHKYNQYLVYTSQNKILRISFLLHIFRPLSNSSKEQHIFLKWQIIDTDNFPLMFVSIFNYAIK